MFRIKRKIHFYLYSRQCRIFAFLNFFFIKQLFHIKDKVATKKKYPIMYAKMQSQTKRYIVATGLLSILAERTVEYVNVSE
jgi:hypothetical protein